MKHFAQVAVLTLAAVIGFAAPGAAQNNSAASLRAADIAWAATFTRGDLSGAVNAIDPAGTVLPPNDAKAVGRNAIRKAFGELFALPKLHMSWAPAAVYVARSGEIGYTSGAYHMTFAYKGRTIADRGKYVTVWKHEADGSWKALYDIFNSDLPPAPM